MREEVARFRRWYVLRQFRRQNQSSIGEVASPLLSIALVSRSSVHATTPARRGLGSWHQAEWANNGPQEVLAGLEWGRVGRQYAAWNALWVNWRKSQNLPPYFIFLEHALLPWAATWHVFNVCHHCWTMLNIRVKRHADTAGLNSNHVAFPDKMAIIAERGRCEAHMPEESLVYKYAILHNIYIYML